MAFAPAAMVSAISSSVLPPLAIIGTSGNCCLILRTTFGVSLPQATLRMETPASRRAAISVFSLVTVTTIGASISS